MRSTSPEIWPMAAPTALATEKCSGRITGSAGNSWLRIPCNLLPPLSIGVSRQMMRVSN